MCLVFDFFFCLLSPTAPARTYYCTYFAKPSNYLLFSPLSLRISILNFYDYCYMSIFKYFIPNKIQDIVFCFLNFKLINEYPRSKRYTGRIKRSTAWRCHKLAGVKENCPLTFLSCCVDKTETFTLLFNGKAKDCAWAAKNTAIRCAQPPTRQNCAVTCGQCDGYVG